MRGVKVQKEVSGNEGGSTKSDVDPTDVHEILLNERRRTILRILKELEDDSISMRELSERIAEKETGEKPAPRDTRHSVYVSLQQNHLPKLSDGGVIEDDQHIISLRDSLTTREIYAHLETVPKYGLAWAEYYFLLSVASILLIIASLLQVPPFAQVEPLTIALFALLVHMLSNSYQTLQTGNSFFTRVSLWRHVEGLTSSEETN